MERTVHIIGGGLAGCEAAWQAASRGAAVTLYEMRPERMTPAHHTGWLAELVCSNSLGSNLTDRGSGLLQAELARLGSLIVAVAREARLPAGGALAVDRETFARRVTERITAHPRITLVRREVVALPADGVTVVASGPLTSDALAAELVRLTGADRLFFFDAMAPIVEAGSVDMGIAFRASRYARGEREEGDYLNCPLTAAEYERFLDALLGAETIALRGFERDDPRFFEGCLPVEALARRGRRTLLFGPLRPVGLTDPRTGQRPFAVVQLRQDNLAGTLCSLVGFQTNLRWPEQERVFRLIPGLGRAEFVRHGQMHRNTFLSAPTLLRPTLQLRSSQNVLVAGQLAGIEGYLGNAGSGLLAGINASRLAAGEAPLELPCECMLGALIRYITHVAPVAFQPMKANFGLLPPLGEAVRGKRLRFQALAARALRVLDAWCERVGVAGGRDGSSPAVHS
ncbi:MAG: Methylenetetrahydrofolate--tRNA-(uracil-5-)-methyltransferase TrmFO [Lentisphaerae bacterium ADurb.BinA184]|nr:MAG: Methylenetetrahydrofolate--tRNA-(uracil-5-)-methyltransferase TrmFO [Lentisphaerae bacterium ADurb.BinA184]